ncbi:MAG: glycosyltransferase family 2 protein [Ilumatobacteraceae bacterium]
MTDPHASSHPHVRVVVLNFDGGQMTLDCIDSLLATDWPVDRLEIVVVDNGSLDHVAERLTTSDRYRSVRVLEPLANLGFAAGCNLGMMLPGDHEFVALVNNDATVEPGWLWALVDTMAESDDIGAVNAKLLFAERYHGIEFAVSPVTHIAFGETRWLGVRVSGVRLDGERVDDRLAFDEHFYLAEAPVEEAGEEIARWSTGRGALRIAANGGAPRKLAVRLSCPEQRVVQLRSDVEERTVAIGAEPEWVEIALPPEPFDVINNVGSNLYRDGYGGDRGFLEVDRGQFDAPADVFAWCGGAVLLRRAYLDDVGLFDPRFFLYYEDTDLSWRGRLRGWRYRYAPGAVVRHRHGASAGAGSPVFNHYTERNRLLTLAKNAPAPLAWRAGLGELRRLVRSFLANFVRRPLTGRFPDRVAFDHRWAVAASSAASLPSMLAQRWSGDNTVGRKALMAWEVDKWDVDVSEPEHVRLEELRGTHE